MDWPSCCKEGVGGGWEEHRVREITREKYHVRWEWLPFFISSAEGRRWLVSPHHEPQLLDRDYRGRSWRIIDDRGWCGLLAGRSLPASRGDWCSHPLVSFRLSLRSVFPSKKWRLSVGKRAPGSPTLPNQSIPPHPPPSLRISIAAKMEVMAIFFRVFRGC